MLIYQGVTGAHFRWLPSHFQISIHFQLRGAWVSATGRLATEHHRISTVPHGVLQVRHFGAGRDGLPQRLDSWDLLGLAGGPVEVRRLRRNSQKMRRKSEGTRGNSMKFPTFAGQIPPKPPSGVIDDHLVCWYKVLSVGNGNAGKILNHALHHLCGIDHLTSKPSSDLTDETF